jgi:CheY-like chemotaxis protein
VRRPIGRVDGFVLDGFQPGLVYEVGVQLAAVLLSEGWAEPAVEPIPAPAPPAAKRRASGGVVLLIEDDPALRLALSTLLQSDGYTVVAAQHGKDGLQRLLDRRPDVIVLDLDMPVMDGWQFRAEQRQLADKALAAVPVLLCTATPDPNHHFDALQATALIEKPVDVVRLLDTLHAVVPPAGA